MFILFAILDGIGAIASFIMIWVSMYNLNPAPTTLFYLGMTIMFVLNVLLFLKLRNMKDDIESNSRMIYSNEKSSAKTVDMKAVQEKLKKHEAEIKELKDRLNTPPPRKMSYPQ